LVPSSDSAAVFAYLTTTACCILLMKRSSNWRIRFLGFSIGLMPLCQSIIILGNHQMWVGPMAGRAAEVLELPASALSLAAVYLLNKENESRRNTDSRLRVAEATPMALARPETAPAKPQIAPVKS
jgi:hypothetical protein